ncbi:hypothetical protein QFZ94_006882 [Paraburkholderia sp. JPY465]
MSIEATQSTDMRWYPTLMAIMVTTTAAYIILTDV